MRGLNKEMELDINELDIHQLREMMKIILVKLDELQEKVNNIERLPLPMPDTWTVPSGTVIPTPAVTVTTTAGGSGSWTSWKLLGKVDE